MIQGNIPFLFLDMVTFLVDMDGFLRGFYDGSKGKMLERHLNKPGQERESKVLSLTEKAACI